MFVDFMTLSMPFLIIFVNKRARQTFDHKQINAAVVKMIAMIFFRQMLISISTKRQIIILSRVIDAGRQTIKYFSSVSGRTVVSLLSSQQCTSTCWRWRQRNNMLEMFLRFGLSTSGLVSVRQVCKQLYRELCWKKFLNLFLMWQVGKYWNL